MRQLFVSVGRLRRSGGSSRCALPAGSAGRWSVIVEAVGGLDDGGISEQRLDVRVGVGTQAA